MPTDRIEAWLRMRDTARFKRDADTAGDAVERIGKKSKSADAQMGLLERTSGSVVGVFKSIGMTAFTVVSRLAAIGGAAAAAGTALGLKFNANMEQNEVAFKNFLGSTKEATKFLDNLYEIAATTPFEFSDITQAAQKLLAFGFTADKVTSLFGTIGDTVAGLGGGAEEINRITMAMGQMQAKGKVQTEEVLQLAELGVPAFKILRKELGLTGDELSKALATGAIDAETGINALQRGMDAAFGGASVAQAKTFNGQLSTMKDYAASALGALTKPLFELIKSQVFPKINDGLEKITTWAKDGGPARAVKEFQRGFTFGSKNQISGGLSGLTGIGQKLGYAWSKFVVPAFKMAKDYVLDLWDALKPAQPFLENILIPLLIGFGKGAIGGVLFALKALIPVVKVAATVLGFIGKIAKPLRPLFEGIGFVLGFLASGPLLNGIKVFRVLFGAMRSVGRVAGWIIGRWKTLNKFFAGLIERIGSVLVLGGKHLFEVGKRLMTSLWDGFKSALGSGASFALDLAKPVANSIIGLLNKAIPDKIPLGPLGSISLPQIPMLADGGTILPGGTAVVGEAGPEIAQNQGGKTVVTPLAPIARGRSGAGLSSQIHIHIDNVMSVDGAVLARATAKQIADWKSRKGQPA